MYRVGVWSGGAAVVVLGGDVCGGGEGRKENLALELLRGFETAAGRELGFAERSAAAAEDRKSVSVRSL